MRIREEPNFLEGRDERKSKDQIQVVESLPLVRTWYMTRRDDTIHTWNEIFSLG